MAEACRICESAPSKYRCPSCDVRYCSVTCFKTHEVIHAKEPPKQPTTTASAAVSTPTPTPSAPRPARRPAVDKIDFSGIEDDPDLRRLLNKHARLRIQLQSVYGFTLEPMLEDRSASRPQQGRGGYRGRGRGGRGSFKGSGQRSSPWTRERGEKEASAELQKLSNGDDDDDGVAEFVRLVAMRYGMSGGQQEAGVAMSAG